MAPPARVNSSERPLLHTSTSTSHILQEPDVGYDLWARYTEQYHDDPANDDTGSSEERAGWTASPVDGSSAESGPARPRPPRFFLGRDENVGTKPTQRPSGTSLSGAAAATSPRSSVSFANVDGPSKSSTGSKGIINNTLLPAGARPSSFFLGGSSGTRTVESSAEGPGDVDEAHATGSSEEMTDASVAKLKTRARSSSSVSKSGNGISMARRTQSKILSGEADEESSSSDYYSRPRTRILSPRAEPQVLAGSGHSGDYFNHQHGSGTGIGTGNGKQPQNRSRSRSRDARYNHHHHFNNLRSMTEPGGAINIPAQAHTGARAPQALGGQYIVEPWSPQSHVLGLGLEGTDGADNFIPMSPVNGPFGFAMGAAGAGGMGPMRTNTPPGSGSGSSTPTGSITPILVNGSTSGSSGSTSGAPVVGSRTGVGARRATFAATGQGLGQGQGQMYAMSPLGGSPIGSPTSSVYMNQFPGPFANAAYTNSIVGSPNWNLGNGGGGSGTATPRNRHRNSFAAAPPSAFRLSSTGNNSTPDLRSRALSSPGAAGPSQSQFDATPSTVSLHALDVDVNAHLRPNPWVNTSRSPSAIGFNNNFSFTSPLSASTMRLSHLSTATARKSLHRLSKPRKSTALFTGPGSVEKPWFNPPRKKSEIMSDLDKRYANYRTYARLSRWITYAFMVLGLGCAAAFAFLNVTETMGTIFKEGELCMVLEEDFTESGSGSGTGLSGDVWNFEVRMDGFGNGEFEMTTDSPNNTFIQDGILYLVPTLTSDVIGRNAVFDGFTFNLSDCTAPATPAPVSNSTSTNSTTGSNSTAGSNSTSASASRSRSQTIVQSAAAPSASAGANGNGGNNGNGNENFIDFSSSGFKASNSTDQDPTAAGPISPNSPGINPACRATSNNGTMSVINPVMSSRITTRGKKNMRFGRVEVRARMPVGDWLWPAIWMLPENDTYGQWPLSGEIDIVESRGNAISYTKQGSNFVRASLNWGPTAFLNSAFRTFGWWSDKRKSFADDFHTYVLEWDEKYIRSYVDTRLHQMLEIKFNEPFFKRGKFPGTVANGSLEVILQNPWEGQGNAAPFDQSFFLIMDVAVGGTSGWFPDGAGGKPWLDNSGNAMYNFANAQDTWFATWPLDVTKRGMAVDYVKMWQKCSAAP